MIVNVRRGRRVEDEKGRGFVVFAALSFTLAFSRAGRHTPPVIRKSSWNNLGVRPGCREPASVAALGSALCSCPAFEKETFCLQCYF